MGPQPRLMRSDLVDAGCAKGRLEGSTQHIVTRCEVADLEVSEQRSKVILVEGANPPVLVHMNNAIAEECVQAALRDIGTHRPAVPSLDAREEHAAGLEQRLDGRDDGRRIRDVAENLRGNHHIDGGDRRQPITVVQWTSSRPGRPPAC